MYPQRRISVITFATAAAAKYLISQSFNGAVKVGNIAISAVQGFKVPNPMLIKALLDDIPVVSIHSHLLDSSRIFPSHVSFGVWTDNDEMILLGGTRRFGFSEEWTPELRYQSFEIDLSDSFVLRVNTSFEFRFKIHHVLSTVIYNYKEKSNVFITLSCPPIICQDASDQKPQKDSYSDEPFLYCTRGVSIDRKFELFVDRCTVLQLTFDDPESVRTWFNRDNMPIPLNKGVLMKQGNIFAFKYKKKLDKILSKLHTHVAFQFSILYTSSLLFPKEIIDILEYCVSSSIPDPDLLLLMPIFRSHIQGTWDAFSGAPRPDFMEIFKSFIQSYKVVRIPETVDYFHLYHLYVTPTRQYIDGPRVCKSNRTTRHFWKYRDSFLSVSFVDEDGGQIMIDPTLDSSQVFQKILHCLKNGLTICGRTFKFLAFSNSSLRENSVLFFEDGIAGVDCNVIRNWLGDFSGITCAARYAARMGQAFTTTIQSVTLESSQVKYIDDIERNGFCFSDGCGTISKELAENVWHSINQGLDTDSPSAFQIRFGGYPSNNLGAKGMVSVDESLPGKLLCIRKSMLKFDAPNAMNIEVADNADKAREAVLNRQVIVILEDLGVDKQVFLDLQRLQVQKLRKMWESETSLLDLAGREGYFGNFVRLWKNIGWPFWTHNSFIRNCLEHICLYQLKEIKLRSRLKIPGGWTLFGILDETGTLKAGEIYVRVCCGDVDKIITGSVIVYRSPQLHPGDIQPAKAVNYPNLHNYRNIVVFSQHGERDLPSALAGIFFLTKGGDLDGDMFSVVPYEPIFPKKFYKPASYPRVTPNNQEEPVNINDICDFVVEFFMNNKLGVIASRHLALSDQLPRGTLHPDCLVLAELHSVAVDFAKTGISADIKEAPSVVVRPDFMRKHENLMYYESQRVLGLLYRDELLNRCIEIKEANTDIGSGPDVIWKFISDNYEYQRFVDKAKEIREYFEYEKQRILRMVRPELNEYELFTGYINLARLSNSVAYNIQKWIQDEFGQLIARVEVLLKEASTDDEDLKCLVGACYYVSNVVQNAYGNLFGFISLHLLLE